MDADPDRIVADGQLTMSDAAWEQARKGGNRLPEPVEEIIRDLIRRRFLTRQKLSVAARQR